MPNTLLTPSVIAKEALLVLRKNAVMANLVHRDFSKEFAAVGDTVTIRKPATFVANEFSESAGITVQSATETGIPVQMNKLLDVSFEVTSKEMALSVDDFSAQFIVPAMQAFADKIDSLLLALQSNVTNRIVQTNKVQDDIVTLRTHLTKHSTPLTERSYVVSSNEEARMLKSELFVSADKVGDDGTALREASLGRKFGFDCYVDQNTDNVSNLYGMAFHKNAFALVTRALALPEGASNAYIENYEGFGLRVVSDYDIAKKKDIISIDMLCGVKVLDDKLAAVLTSSAGLGA